MQTDTYQSGKHLSCPEGGYNPSYHKLLHVEQLIQPEEEWGEKQELSQLIHINYEKGIKTTNEGEKTSVCLRDECINWPIAFNNEITTTVAHQESNVKAQHLRFDNMEPPHFHLWKWWRARCAEVNMLCM